jgi:hypothetical protein
MRNIQVIDGAENTVYDIFAASDADFALIYPPGEDVAFIDEVIAKHKGRKSHLNAALRRIWKRRIKKRDVLGIHGILFYELPNKKAFYPTRRDEEASNPGGRLLR